MEHYKYIKLNKSKNKNKNYRILEQKVEQIIN